MTTHEHHSPDPNPCRNPDQHRIGSGFGARSTTDDVLRGIDLTGKTALVTGGYSGIGLETTRALAAAGARVVVPARRRALWERSAELTGVDAFA